MEQPHDCRQAAMLISDLASREEVSEGQRSLASSCEVCPQCARLLSEFQAMGARLRAVNAAVVVPRGVLDRVNAALDAVDTPVTHSRARLPARLSWVAAVLVLAVAGWALKMTTDARPFDAAGLISRGSELRAVKTLDTTDATQARDWAARALHTSVPVVPGQLAGCPLESASTVSRDGAAGVVFSYHGGSRWLRYYHFLTGKRPIVGQFSLCPDGPPLLAREAPGRSLVAWQSLDRTYILVAPVPRYQLEQAVPSISGRSH